MNEVIIDGIVFRDVEIRSPQNYTVATFALFHKDPKTNRTSFVDVESWNEVAQTAKKLSRGDFIEVHGSLKQDNYEGKDGTKRSKIKIIAKEFRKNGTPISIEQDTSIKGAVAGDTGEIAFDDDVLPF
jgi:single-strand DNA-binding protein